MKKITTFIVFLTSIFTQYLFAMPVAAPPSIPATSYILLDFHSGKILAEKDSSARIEPASITKIMTGYVVFDAIKQGKLKLDELVTVSEKAWRNPDVKGWMQGSRMFVEVNSQVSVEDLLHGLVIQSGNDASLALAEHIAGTESAFVDLMNAYAQRLGMQDTQYQNSTGWPAEEHYTSAKDIAILSAALIKNFPKLYKLYSKKEFTYNNIPQSNRNTLLWKDASVDGIKTGHTEAAGYCLASSAERKGMRLISVVMGTKSSSSRAKSSQSLLNYGFRFFATHKLFDAGELLKEVRVWKGASKTVQLGLAEDLYVTIPRGEYNNLQSTMDIKKSITAPVVGGEAFGELQLVLAEQNIHSMPLIALNTVEKGNILQRIIDHIIQIFE